MDIYDLCKEMLERSASDLYLTVARPPMFRVNGSLQEGVGDTFKPADIEALAHSFVTDSQWAEFIKMKELNLAIAVPGVSRFRVNVFRQRDSVGLVVRRITVDIPTIEELGLPPVLKEVASLKRGLILVVGGTGSGKSTSLASMIDYRNASQSGHILTVEDPIEFVHRHKKSVVTQREVGFDTLSYESALTNALRQAPDVILIGEIRHAETMEAAITFADTGHLCLGTLHSTNANQSFERILNFFPPVKHAQVLLQMSLNLRAVIAQRLMPGVNGGRVPAVEVLLDTPFVKALIKKGEVGELKGAMEQGIHEGCQTFDQALFTLYRDGAIRLEEALANADSANNLRLKIKLAGLSGEEDAQTEAPGSPDADGQSATSELMQKASHFRIRSR
jgi:twitching motility protein PilU